MDRVKSVGSSRVTDLYACIGTTCNSTEMPHQLIQLGQWPTWITVPYRITCGIPHAIQHSVCTPNQPWKCTSNTRRSHWPPNIHNHLPTHSRHQHLPRIPGNWQSPPTTGHQSSQHDVPLHLEPPDHRICHRIHQTDAHTYIQPVQKT